MLWRNTTTELKNSSSGSFYNGLTEKNFFLIPPPQSLFYHAFLHFTCWIKLYRFVCNRFVYYIKLYLWISLYCGKLINVIGTINWRRQLFLLALGPKSYVAFDSLTSKVRCTMLLIFKKILFRLQRWRESPDPDWANRNRTINRLTLWSCQGYGNCAATVNIRNNKKVSENALIVDANPCAWFRQNRVGWQRVIKIRR